MKASYVIKNSFFFSIIKDLGAALSDSAVFSISLRAQGKFRFIFGKVFRRSGTYSIYSGIRKTLKRDMHSAAVCMLLAVMACVLFGYCFYNYRSGNMVAAVLTVITVYAALSCDSISRKVNSLLRASLICNILKKI